MWKQESRKENTKKEEKEKEIYLVWLNKLCFSHITKAVWKWKKKKDIYYGIELGRDIWWWNMRTYDNPLTERKNAKVFEKSNGDALLLPD